MREGKTTAPAFPWLIEIDDEELASGESAYYRPILPPGSDFSPETVPVAADIVAGHRFAVWDAEIRKYIELGGSTAKPVSRRFALVQTAFTQNTTRSGLVSVKYKTIKTGDTSNAFNVLASLLHSGDTLFQGQLVVIDTIDDSLEILTGECPEATP